MRPVTSLSLLLLLTFTAIVSGCGKARSNPQETSPNEVLEGDGNCYPLGHRALAESLNEPLAVGRDAFGTVYALSRVGDTSLLWQSQDEWLVPYPVVAENRAGAGGAIFGAEDGAQGFALSLLPEAEPNILRVFHRLADARGNSSGFTTGGTTLELLSPSELSNYTVASESSPALLVGSFRTVADGEPSATLLLVRTGLAADAAVAVFYGDGNALAQRELLELVQQPGELTARFRVDGDELTASVVTAGEQRRGTLSGAGVERELQQGVRSPLGLAQLAFHCTGPVAEAWTRAEPLLPPSTAGCSEPVPLYACVGGPGSANLAVVAESSQVVELGQGLPTDPNGNCGGRALTLAEDPRVSFRWARLSHPLGEVWLTVAGPELELPLTVGQSVTLSWWEQPTFDWRDWLGELQVRALAPNQANDGELLFWLGQADDLFVLNGVATFDLIPGPERCITRSECGDAVSGYSLASRAVSSVGPNGTPQLIGYGERVRQGAHYVYNGGIEAQTAGPQCSFKALGNARMAIWKATDN